LNYQDAQFTQNTSLIQFSLIILPIFIQI